jgi:hypothetical protein
MYKLLLRNGFNLKEGLFLVVVLALTTSSWAQQNLFNIPSSDITQKGKMFYQHQLNVYANKLESKAHFVYGLGKGWDVGANLVGKGFYFPPEWRAVYNDNPAQGAVYPILMGTVQKQFNVSKRFDINIGAQIGHNLSNKIENKRVNYFTYALSTYYFDDDRKSRIVGGLYKTNQMFVGNGNTFGALLGYEVKLSKRFYLMGDWISGRNDAAVGVVGGMYNLTKRIQLCAGLQVPNPNTPKPFGAVLEINLLGWNVF